jgi:hypothetical protein
MKTKLDLPIDLVQQLKFHAVQERRKIKDIVATFIAEGLAKKASTAQPQKGHITFPLIPCGPNALAQHMTIDETLAEEQAILTQQDVEYYT